MSFKAPQSLRHAGRANASREKADLSSGAITAAALIAAGTAATAANAQSALPAVTVDAPKPRLEPVTVAQKPTPVQARARVAVRRVVRQRVVAQPIVVPGPAPVVAPSSNIPIFAQASNANPYAQPGDPYKVNRVQSNKISEPIANTPRTITVLPKEVLADKGATTLRELGRSTAGVTLGTGEGGNAFGDRFFIRGFDVRNDIFVDGVRDPGVSVRENFFTEQVEILRGPGSTFAGRGTAGGAINIVTKQANLDHDFRIIEGNLSPTSDQTKRVTVDINQTISPVLAVRGVGLYQKANVAGRDFVTDDRYGGHGSVVFKPLDNLTLTASFTHTDLRSLPDFGVPYNRISNRPFTEGIIPRTTYYGFVNRDFQHVRQDIATVTGEYRFNENFTVSTKFRREKSLLSYVGTLAEGFAFPAFTIASNPQSRYQTLGVFANQTEGTIKFDTGPVRHTTVVGMELSHEQYLRDSYNGLSSEAVGIGAFNGSGSVTQSVFFPNNTLAFNRQPALIGNPNNISIDTKAGYLIHTANYNDYIILNGGLRVDDFTISSYSPTVAAAGFFLRGGGNPFTATAYNHSTMFNYNLGAVWKPIPIVSLYTAYATSSNPVGAELDGTTATYGGLNQTDQIFSPEKNKAVEAGVKIELFDRRLLVSGALFQTTKTNARELIGPTVYANAAYKIQGIDLEVAGKITDRWSVIGGAVFMDTHVTKSQAPSNVGLPLANIAHTSFSMLSKYQLLDWLELGGQAVYNSRRYGGTFLVANGATAINATTFLPAPTAANPFVNVPTVLPSYWRFDTFAEMKFGDNLKGKLAVYNLFNRTYYDAFYQSSAPFAQIAPGRVVQFTLAASF